MYRAQVVLFGQRLGLLVATKRAHGVSHQVERAPEFVERVTLKFRGQGGVGLDPGDQRDRVCVSAELPQLYAPQDEQSRAKLLVLEPGLFQEALAQLQCLGSHPQRMKPARQGEQDVRALDRGCGRGRCEGVEDDVSLVIEPLEVVGVGS